MAWWWMVWWNECGAGTNSVLKGFAVRNRFRCWCDSQVLLLLRAGLVVFGVAGCGRTRCPGWFVSPRCASLCPTRGACCAAARFPVGVRTVWLSFALVLLCNTNVEHVYLRSVVVWPSLRSPSQSQ